MTYFRRKRECPGHMGTGQLAYDAVAAEPATVAPLGPAWYDATTQEIAT